MLTGDPPTILDSKNTFPSVSLSERTIASFGGNDSFVVFVMILTIFFISLGAKRSRSCRADSETAILIICLPHDHLFDFVNGCYLAIFHLLPANSNNIVDQFFSEHCLYMLYIIVFH